MIAAARIVLAGVSPIEVTVVSAYLVVGHGSTDANKEIMADIRRVTGVK